MKEFLHFDRMITGDIIKYVFWVLSGICVLMGVVTLLGSLAEGEFVGVLGAILIAVLGPVIIRIYCELMIILFKIHENLVAIRNK
jgi:hypothetical protein